MPHAALSATFPPAKSALAAGQLGLFEAFPAAPSGPAAPPIALPFQESASINVARARKILRVSKGTVYRMCERGLLRGYRLTGAGAGARAQQTWKIEYDSVVAHCDRLLAAHGIAPRAVGKTNLRGRRRDADLLPFPASEETTLRAVAARLGCRDMAVIHLIESGGLIAYQVIPGLKGSGWRIHAPSVDAYILSLHRQLERAAQRPAQRPAQRSIQPPPPPTPQHPKARGASIPRG